MKNLYINNKKISYTDIKNKKFDISFDDYELQTLNFCYEWLNNKDEFIINTSGSTGTPKPISLKRTLMIKSAELTGEFLKLKQNENILVVVPTYYIAGLMMLVRGFVLDLNIFIYTPSSNPIENINLKDHKFSLASFVPLQIFEILKSGMINDLNLIKNILIGGGSIDTNLENQLQNLNSNIYHTYGMTETITHIALRKINGEDKSKYFKTLKETKISIDDRNCLIINSPVTGFKNVITNDLVEIKNDSEFIILGRVDNVINSGGIKIQAEKIENIISEIFYKLNINNNFFISSIPDKKLGQKVVLVIESDNIHNFKIKFLEKINLEINDKISKYEKPKSILFINKFLTTNSGKLDKKSTLNEVIQE